MICTCGLIYGTSGHDDAKLYGTNGYDDAKLYGTRGHDDAKLTGTNGHDDAKRSRFIIHIDIVNLHRDGEAGGKNAG